ncbi:MAG: glycosyltransferase family 4 protein [Steroidobacteraceae bacterium]
MSGIATYVQNLAAGLASLNVTPSILSMGSVPPQFLQANVTDVDRIANEASGIIAKFGQRLSRIFDPESEIPRRSGRGVALALRRQPGPQLVEVEESFGFAGWMRSAGIPIVVRLHGPWFINGLAYGAISQRRFARRCQLEFRGMQVAAGITAPSRTVLEQTLARLRNPPRLSAVIPNPVNVNADAVTWNLGGATPARILYVGRFDRIKGPDILFRAFALVLGKVPEAELVFVGPDNGFRDDAGKVWSLEDYLPVHVAENVRRRITVLGAQSAAAIQALRRSCHVAVIASRQETYPLAAIESLCAGTPTVASRVGGVPEIIADEESGLLFRVEDAEHLASQLIRIITIPRLAESLSGAGLASAGRFHPVAVARQTMAFYEAVLGAGTS